MPKSPFVIAVEKNDPKLAAQYESLSQFATSGGAIPQKYKTLMSMFGDALLGHPEGVKVLAQRAREQGATEEEIAETVRMAFYFGGVPALVMGVHAYKEK
jgi:alkylhydroperoxidase/carboxymuconolactone decarboxylase family protein YurZ